MKQTRVKSKWLDKI